jgi:hypothetical protein
MCREKIDRKPKSKTETPSKTVITNPNPRNSIKIPNPEYLKKPLRKESEHLYLKMI